MEVGPRCQARLADVTDNLPLFDRTAAFHALPVTGQVGIKSAVFAAMLQDDRLSITALGADVLNCPVTGRLDRRTGGCGIVHSSVRPDPV